MIEPTPPEVTLSVGEVISAALKADLDAYDCEWELAVRFECARHLSHCLGPLLGVPQGEVWEALTHVPDNLLGLLDSPEGWVTLSGIVAYDLGISPPAYLPAIN